MQSRLSLHQTFDLVAHKATFHLGKQLANAVTLHSFESPLLSGAGFWLLLNSEVFAPVRMEDGEGLKERNTRGFSKIGLAPGGCRAVEDQRKPRTHARGNAWRREAAAS